MQLVASQPISVIVPPPLLNNDKSDGVRTVEADLMMPEDGFEYGRAELARKQLGEGLVERDLVIERTDDRTVRLRWTVANPYQHRQQLQQHQQRATGVFRLWAWPCHGGQSDTGAAGSKEWQAALPLLQLWFGANNGTVAEPQWLLTRKPEHCLIFYNLPEYCTRRHIEEFCGRGSGNDDDQFVVLYRSRDSKLAVFAQANASNQVYSRLMGAPAADGHCYSTAFPYVRRPSEPELSVKPPLLCMDCSLFPLHQCGRLAPRADAPNTPEHCLFRHLARAKVPCTKWPHCYLGAKCFFLHRPGALRPSPQANASSTGSERLAWLSERHSFLPLLELIQAKSQACPGAEVPTDDIEQGLKRILPVLTESGGRGDERLVQYLQFARDAGFIAYRVNSAGRRVVQLLQRGVTQLTSGGEDRSPWRSVCRHFRSKGACDMGDRCAFRHPLPVARPRQPPFHLPAMNKLLNQLPEERLLLVDIATDAVIGLLLNAAFRFRGVLSRLQNNLQFLVEVYQRSGSKGTRSHPLFVEAIQLVMNDLHDTLIIEEVAEYNSNSAYHANSVEQVVEIYQQAFQSIDQQYQRQVDGFHKLPFSEVPIVDLMERLGSVHSVRQLRRFCFEASVVFRRADNSWSVQSVGDAFARQAMALNPSIQELLVAMRRSAERLAGQWLGGARALSQRSTFHDLILELRRRGHPNWPSFKVIQRYSRRHVHGTAWSESGDEEQLQYDDSENDQLIYCSSHFKLISSQ